MLAETQEYYNIGSWLSKMLNHHRCSKFLTTKKLQVNHGEIWYCDLGYNVGTEKNKIRPVLVLSNNKVNQAEKVVIVSITDAKGKLNARDLPLQDSWYLLYSNTTDDNKKIYPGRLIRKGNTPYEFLEKDSIVQCEEIRAVSKARLDAARKCIGTLDSKDFNNIKQKLIRTYNL